MYTMDELVAAECLIERRVDDALEGVEPGDEPASLVKNLDVGRRREPLECRISTRTRTWPAGIHGGTDGSVPSAVGSELNPSSFALHSPTS